MDETDSLQRWKASYLDNIGSHMFRTSPLNYSSHRELWTQLTLDFFNIVILYESCDMTVFMLQQLKANIYYDKPSSIFSNN